MNQLHKTILILLGLIISPSILAVVSLHLSSTQPGATVADEAIIDDTALLQSKTNETSIDVKYKWNVDAGSEEDIFVRLDLENAVFNSSLNPNMITDDAASSFSILKGGAAEDNYVIIAVTPSSFIQIEKGIFIDFGLDTTGSAVNLRLANKATVFARYSLYRTKKDAISKNNELTSVKGTLIEFEKALVLKGGSSNKTKLIDKSTGSFRFMSNDNSSCVEKDGSLCSPIMNVTLDKSSYSTVAPNDLGKVLAMGNVISAAKLQITGDFSSVTQVYIDNTKFDCSANDFSADLSEDRQLASFTIINIIKNESVVCIEVSGHNPIPASTYTGKLTFASQPGFNVPAIEIIGDNLK